jgi:hypothetical protein
MLRCVHLRFTIVTVAVVILAGVVPVFAAYVYPLSSTDIRDAYFIGHRNDEITSDFLAKYTRHLDKPSSGPYISDVAIATPFSQIVVHASKLMSYNAPTAVQDFQDKPMKFYVHITIYVANDFKIEQTNPPDSLNPSYAPFWQDFKIKLTQGDKHVVRPLNTGGSFIYPNSGPDDMGPITPIGAQVDLEYSADKIDTDTTVISIDTPDGQHAEATFDLASLR